MTGLKQKAARLRQAYAPHEHRPLGGYLVGDGHLRRRDRRARRPGQGDRPPGARASRRRADVVLLSIATHKLSRLLSKDAITSPLRAPFTRYDRPIGSGEVMEQVRDSGSPTRHAIGELLSCPFCLAVWVATGLTGGLVLAPRLTRLVATALTAVAASDFLQMGVRRRPSRPPRAGTTSD